MLDSMVSCYFESVNDIWETNLECANYRGDPISTINELIPEHFERQDGNLYVDLVQKKLK
jgi:hypothetical protein